MQKLKFAFAVSKANYLPEPEALATVRAQALARRGRAEEAVAAVREALKRAPENPQWAYEAALVYCVVGDETSALLEARRALGIRPGRGAA